MTAMMERMMTVTVIVQSLSGAVHANDHRRIRVGTKVAVPVPKARLIVVPKDLGLVRATARLEAEGLLSARLILRPRGSTGIEVGLGVGVGPRLLPRSARRRGRRRINERKTNPRRRIRIRTRRSDEAFLLARRYDYTLRRCLANHRYTR
ncbi:hypothetical protein F5887DRAFT_964909 [Amanita rubescens]|nr:hypothetical protein F5887DRAFT_964909 [Amanita rubescens]